MGLQQLQECVSRTITLPHNSQMSAEDVYRCLDLLNTYFEQIKNIPKLKKISNTVINITADSLIEDTDFAEYPYRYNIALEGVTTEDYPTVVFNQNDALGGNFAPYVKSYNGGISIYLKNNTAVTTTIPIILLM